MRTREKYPFVFYVICLLSTSLMSQLAVAQQAILTAGMSEKNEIGSISQSIGLVQYQNIINSSGQIQEGVISNYKLIELPTSNIDKIEIDIQAYPNPVSEGLYLSAKNTDISTLNFHLLDVKGRKLENLELNTIDQSLSLKQYKSGVYILQIYFEFELIKSFKLIKN